ncbi:uncharacterized protein BJ212DRAFT_744412 [Suillus subaureus]|uniref:Uncharacterized protein n=1 Tax=Suillus subaureus TaxID=48587 RepID=A0A9P7DZT7_9AGAM|nr:uncharacterized protein BJ212DRAFT_744412 [Suillus subaureus]KAG1807437.1 hypothetical protein BJ212DRAFT_744412 [Suillus subaureus]
MVTIASPQSNEAEQKKRKQTLERAKASHLSKQLQMRLQYAKLKVEHGWQRQNLNEVENLYFHHSQVRGLRPVVPAKTVPLLSTNPLPPTAPVPEPPEPVAVDEVSQQVINSQAPPIDTSRGHTSPHNSPVKLTSTHVQSSFTDTTSKSSLHTLQTLPEKAPSQEPSQPAPAPVHLSTQSATVLQELPNSETVAPPYNSLDFSDPAAMAPSHSQIPTQIQTHTQSQPYNPYMPLNRQSSQPQPNPFMPQPLPQYSFTQSYHATSLQNQSNPQTSHSQPSANLQSSFGNGNGSGPLTYDSFWSTHASAGSLYRTHGGFTASATPTGHVAMITPGGHAAVMTAEGVYVGTAGYTGRVSG